MQTIDAFLLHMTCSWQKIQVVLLVNVLWSLCLPCTAAGFTNSLKSLLYCSRRSHLIRPTAGSAHWCASADSFRHVSGLIMKQTFNCLTLFWLDTFTGYNSFKVPALCYLELERFDPSFHGDVPQIIFKFLKSPPPEPALSYGAQSWNHYCCSRPEWTLFTSHFWTGGARGQSVWLFFSSAVLSPSSGPVSAEAPHCWLP